MLSTYCQHCGAKHEYNLHKPNFCSSCGQSLSGEYDPSKAESQSSVVEVDAEDYGVEGTDVYRVPRLRALEYDIEVSNASKFTLGSLMPGVKQQTEPESELESIPTRKRRGRPRKNG